MCMGAGACARKEQRSKTFRFRAGRHRIAAAAVLRAARFTFFLFRKAFEICCGRREEMGDEDAEIQSKILCFKSYAQCRKQVVNLH